MEGEEKESWMELCELAAKEQDPAKLLEVVQEINRILEKREARLREKRDLKKIGPDKPTAEC